MTTPPLALTLGDPDGIGPEIALKAWQHHQTSPFRYAIHANREQLSAYAASLGIAAPVAISAPQEAQDAFTDGLPVLPIEHAETAAGTALASINAAVEASLAGTASGVVTNPISKAVMYEAGFKFPGHTEYLAHLSADAPLDGARGPVMMLAGGGLRCALVTIHQSLRSAIDSLTPERIIHTTTVTAEAVKRDFAIKRPRLAIAGLNPHAGEGGSLGAEEIEIVEPAVTALQEAGFDVFGPLPPDTMFHAEARAGYDAAICLYHDQGLIPVKTLDFHGGVNVTLGLPMIRTSPDHGTAFDIAGKGIARPDSLIAAIELAAELAANRANAS
ncbi:4-hydroxythreonine-4-phosphate dehydrogenase PdxA [Maricaulaceae bacterium NA33B04]|nr:4-hydroxythreonine-4-phosphate dehydrogenase PdxA [Maricaulaceae bacterium NA33B04]